MNFGMAILKIRALITVHHHKWLTRPVEVVDGQIVRIDPSKERRVDHPPLRARLAGTGVALSLFFAVQFLLLGFGGAGYLPRADTTRPEVAAAVPASVPAGSPILAGVVVTGEDDSAGLSYVWTLQGAYLGSAPEVMLPPDLAPGRYLWAVHVRDGSGNTTSRDGVLVVTGGSEASSEAAAP